MTEAISNTSPVLYLHRGGALEWLPLLFDEMWIPNAVVLELEEGQRGGYDVPDPKQYDWLEVIDPCAVPSEWLALDLGAGELAAMSLALEHPERVVLLDDALARRIAEAAGLEVWGTLRVLLEAKKAGLIEAIEPLVRHLRDRGMWISKSILKRILILAGEE
ncbi:MAG: DUF3368 domain-containing protein [Anaerolineales bacterium]